MTRLSTNLEVPVFRVNADQTAPMLACRLTHSDAHIDSYTNEAGVPYLAGHIETRDPDGAEKLLLGRQETEWIAWGETFIRIHSISRYITNGHRMVIDVDQSHPQPVCLNGHYLRANIRVVEPSPPRPWQEWAEQARDEASKAWEAQVLQGTGPR